MFIRNCSVDAAKVFCFVVVGFSLFLAEFDNISNAAESNQKLLDTSAYKNGWGTYLKPFAAESLWNSRPVKPAFGDFVIPKSDYFPSVAEGKWSSSVFLAKATDGPITVKGIPGGKGLWDPDSETMHDVTIPHWPADVVPATANDGHADVVDETSGIIHSFHQLRYLDGQWVARQYAWSKIDGRGWGDPAHYFQGARAAAVSTTAGLIRKHEINDGQPTFQHALAMSLTYNALSANPTHIFPATAADWNAATTNYGQIPEGALLMLPDSYDTGQIANLDLRKIAETLKRFGAYVVDRNIGTPFYIYVEIGSGYNLHKGGWNNTVAIELDRIRQSLRQVVSVNGWLDGNGRPFNPERNLNLLSMRGPWRLQSGLTPGDFDSWKQAVVFPSVQTRVVQINDSSRGMNPVPWAIPIAGKNYRLTALSTGGAKLHLQLRDKSAGTIIFDSGELGNGETAQFSWPTQNVGVIVYAVSGVGQASTVRGELVGLGS